ncbi:MAG: hypothetical protein CMH12_00755 [Maritimibacter sp.]|nr:hypothetical protein [Maritimibacter sp.]
MGALPPPLRGSPEVFSKRRSRERQGQIFAFAFFGRHAMSLCMMTRQHIASPTALRAALPLAGLLLLSRL